MKITKIESFPVKLQFKEPFIIANISNYDMYYIIVKLTTDEGIIGYGEAIPAWEVTGETQFSVIDVINHFCEPKKSGFNLIGQSINTLEEVHNLFTKIIPQGHLAIIAKAPSAKAALEGAILDALGKKHNKPVYKLFNGKSKSIPVNKVIGIYPIEESLKRVQNAINSNVSIIKLKVGIPNIGNLPDFKRDIELIKSAHKLIRDSGKKIKLVADANQGFITPEKTIEICNQIEGCLDWLEQPIYSEDKTGFKKIKENCNIKLMADESIHSFYDAKFLLESGSIDYINLKIMKTGGLFEALRIADLAAIYKVPCQMGSMLENVIGCAHSIHTYLSHPNIVTAELSSFTRLKECIGSGVTLNNNQTVSITENSGLGVEVNDSEIQKFLITEDDSITFQQTKGGFNVKRNS